MSEAEILKALDLGKSVDTLRNSPRSPLGELLTNLTQSIIDQLRGAIDARRISTSTNNLSQSIVPSKASFNGSEVSIELSMAYYWKYINYGVNGTVVNHGAPSWGGAPPSEVSYLDSILQWIPARGLMLPAEFKTYKSFAFAIMQSIKEKGKAPRPFFEDVINESTIRFLREPIARVFGESIKIIIKSPWQ